MALAFNKTKGSAQKDRPDSYDYKDGENRVRLIGDLLARYVYWIKGENNKNLPFECLAFNRETEKFDNAESDVVKNYYPDLKCSWAYAIQCLDLATGEIRILNLKKKLLGQIQDLADQLEADPTDPDTGFDVIFTKKKTGPLTINVEYTVQQVKSKVRSLTDVEREKIANLKSMDEILPRPTPDQQDELLKRLANGSTENVDEEVGEEFDVK
jgi:hypothetical protein